MQVRFVGPDVAILNGVTDAVVTVGRQHQNVSPRFMTVYARQQGARLFEAWHSVRRPAGE